jgi:hypothetical protein
MKAIKSATPVEFPKVSGVLFAETIKELDSGGYPRPSI